MNSDSGPWWREVTSQQWYALLAALIGYTLDAFDVMVFTFCLPAIREEWSLSPAQAGLLMTVTLLSSSVGGIIFGVFADRHGRKRALMLTVLVFSICSGLSGLAQNLIQLGLARAVLGLGMGGEWATGVLMISETWPARHRGKAIGLMQSGWALGSIAAALAAGKLLPIVGWRVLFFLGVAPAFFTIWIRSKVKEPALWKQMTSERDAEPSNTRGFLEIFCPDLRRFTVVSTLISTFVMFGYWGLFSWVPGFLAAPVGQGGAGLSIAAAAFTSSRVMAGAFCGYVSFGFIADRLGRRPTFMGYLFVSALLVWLYGRTRDPGMLDMLGPFVGFFGSGYFSAFGAFISELFPTRVRGSAVGFCYNVGRMLGGAAPVIIGGLSTRYGFGGAFALLAVAFATGAMCIFLLPETQGTTLK